MKKNFINRLVAMILTLPLMFSVGMTAWAKGDISVNLNGNGIYFDQPPIIRDGRTLVPMRAIFEAMDCDVKWDGASKVIDVYKNNANIMTMWVDNFKMWTKDNGYITLDVPPQIINSRTLVPVRAISESIGAEVNWDTKTQTVSIKYTQEVEVTVPYDDVNEECEHPENYIDEEVHEEVKQINDKVWHQIVTTTERYCTNCGETLEPQIHILNEEHDFNNRECTKCGYKEDVQKPSISVSSGDLDIDDDGNFKVLHLKSGESFMATNMTESSFNISIEKNDYAKQFHFIVYKPDGNVETTGYSKSISGNGNRQIKPNYSIGIYNPNEYTIDIKAPSDVFYPEDKEAFEIIDISPKQGNEIENTSQADFNVYITGNNYDAKRYSFVLYKSDGNIETTGYNKSISGNSNKQIKPGYSLGIYNCSSDTISVMKPSMAGNASQNSVFNIKSLSGGESCKITNNTKTAFTVLVEGSEKAKKFDYTVYKADGETETTQYNKSISGNSNRQLKPGYSISISNSSDDTIYVYVPEKVN